MIAVEKYADGGKRKIRKISDQIGGHMTGDGDVFASALSLDLFRSDLIEAGGLIQDVICGGYIDTASDDISDGAVNGGDVDDIVVQFTEGGQPFNDAFDLANVGGDFLCDVLHDIVAETHAEVPGFIADDRHSRFYVRRLHVCHQPALKTGAQTVIQQEHIDRRPVRGGDDLMSGFVDIVEGMEEFLL